MNDPFDVLRLVDQPLPPRAEFASALRDQLTDALSVPLTQETTMTDTDSNTSRQSVTAYLSVHDCAAALAFYAEAFGAVESNRLVGDDGRIGHAEFTIGTTTMMIADEYPEVDVLGPRTRGGPTCQFTIDVPDVDAAFAKAVAAGATVLREVADQFHGSRMGTLADPFGHRWTLSTPIAGFQRSDYVAGGKEAGYELIDSAQLKTYAHGDLYYFTIPVPDLDKAKAFFAAVLGWQFDESGNGHATNISAPPGGVRPATEMPTTQLWFVVDDIHAAVAAVRANGGTSDEPVHYDSGWSADCVDDQGTAFSLSVPAAKYRL